MSVTTLRLSELSSLSPDERTRRLHAFAALRNQPLNGELAFLDEQIAELERRYEISSEAMKQDFHAGKIRETAEICTWLILLDARDQLGVQTT